MTQPDNWKRALLSTLPAALALLAIYSWYAGTYAAYAPFGDDPAIIGGSLGNPTSWFTSGFSQYFVVYPEWAGGTTDFFRPGVNLLVRLEYLLFGQRFWLYFVLLFLAQLSVCFLVVDILRRAGLPPARRALFGLLTALSPALLGAAVENVSYHFDIWCGLLSFLAFYLVLRDKYGAAFLCMCAAVLTKEASLFVPVAACITAYVRTRRAGLAGSLLLPLVGWFLIRKFVFVGSLENVYAVQVSAWGALKIFKGLAIWPTGVPDPPVLRQMVDDRSIGAHLGDAVMIGINLVLWIVLLLGAARIIQRYFKSNAAPGVLQITLLWLAGALAFGVLAGQESRFGGAIYPLEIVFVALLVSHPEMPGLPALGRTACAILGIAFLWNAGRELRQHSTQPAAMKSLMAVIKEQTAPVVYILSAPLDWTSTPNSVATLINSPARIVVLSQFAGCLNGPGGTTRVGGSAPQLSIEVQYPDCAQLRMGSVPARILGRGVGGELTRGEFARYQFPQGQVLTNAKAVGAEPTVTLGTKLDLTLDPGPPGSYALLYYDWNRGSYVSAGSASLGNQPAAGGL
jgi:hypothetical protein